MNLLADIIMAILAVVIIIRCTKMGCFKAVTNLIKLGVAILLTAAFGKTVSNIFYEKLFYPRVSSWVSGELNTIAENANNSVSGMLNGFSDKFQKLLDTVGVNIEILKDKYLAEENIDTALEGMTHDISSPFAKLLSNVVGYLTLFIVIIVILTIVFYVLNKIITNIPIIKSCNKVLGLVFGFACGFLALCICSYVLTAVFGFLKQNPETIANDSILYKVFYKIDLFSLFK